MWLSFKPDAGLKVFESSFVVDGTFVVDGAFVVDDSVKDSIPFISCSVQLTIPNV